MRVWAGSRRFDTPAVSCGAAFQPEIMETMGTVLERVSSVGCAYTTARKTRLQNSSPNKIIKRATTWDHKRARSLPRGVTGHLANRGKALTKGAKAPLI